MKLRDKMSFDKILKRKGQSISQIEIIRTSVNGYVDTSENVTTITGIIQPLSSAERLFWAEAGITKSMLNVFTDTNLNVGDKITFNNENYMIISTEDHRDKKTGGYKKAVAEKHP
jgi:hypothetical protein